MPRSYRARHRTRPLIVLSRRGINSRERGFKTSLSKQRNTVEGITIKLTEITLTADVLAATIRGGNNISLNSLRVVELKRRGNG